MKKFASSKLELQLLKSEIERVENGNGFIYEELRYNEILKLLDSIHPKIALRRVRFNKNIYYKRECTQ